MIHSRTKILTLALSKQGPHVHLYVLLRSSPPAIVRAYYNGNTCPSGQASNARKDKKNGCCTRTPRNARLLRRHPLIPAAMVRMGASERSWEIFPMAYRIPMLTRGVEA